VISVRDQTSFLGQGKPPVGYRLTYCIGTTFSLDLECLLQLALNFRRIESPLTELKELEAFVALEEFQMKSVVFCQNCRIKESRFLLEETRGSKGLRKLLATLDAAVVPIPAPAFKAAFHPKVWFFRFDGDRGQVAPIFRLSVQSRNLTSSRDWDISAAFTGSWSRTRATRNRTLVAFLNRLNSQGRGARKQKLIQRAVNDLDYVVFSAMPDMSERWEFLFRWHRYANTILIDPSRYRELIAVSPFLGKTVNTLEGLNSTPKFTLITGPKDIETVARVKGLAEHTYVMAATNEGVWDTTEARPDQLGLHAKIYLGLSKNSDDVDIFVGSANLTDAAFRGQNCEAVVHLKGNLRHFRAFESEFIYRDRKKEILHPWLQKYETLLSQGGTDIKEDPSIELLENLRSRISQGTFYLRFPRRTSKAALRFSSNAPVELPADVGAHFRLATSAEIAPLEPVLRGVEQVFVAPADERSEFLIVRLTHGNRELRFVTVAISDLNRSARSRSTLNRLVRNADAFYDLLGLLLRSTIQTSHPGWPFSRREPERKSKGAPSRRSIKRHAFLEPLLLSGLMEPEVEDEIEAAIGAFLAGRRPPSEKKSVAEFQQFWKRYRRASAALRQHA
jgi:hypothetical protein